MKNRIKILFKLVFAALQGEQLVKTLKQTWQMGASKKLIGISAGASLFNIFFMAVVGLNFLGLIPYILHKKPLPDNERSPS